MNLENVTVEMRPRSEWEAADFGARMIRRDAKAIYLVWFAVTLPLLALALLAIIYTPYVGTRDCSCTGGWNPSTDGPILRIISRRLFGENANVLTSLRYTPKLRLVEQDFPDTARIGCTWRARSRYP